MAQSPSSSGYSANRPNFWQRHYRPIIYLLTLVCVWLGTSSKRSLSLNVSEATDGVYSTLEHLDRHHAKVLAEQRALLQHKLQNATTNNYAKLQSEINDLREYIARLEINSNGVVLICIDFDPGTDAELSPMAHAIIRHAFSRGIKVLVNTGYNVMSQPLAQNILSQAVTDGASMPRPYPFMEAGRDYVFFGFRPNAFQLYLQMGESIVSAYETDYSGHDLSTLPIMRGIKNFNDIDMVISVSGYVGSPEMWINVGKTKFNKFVGLGMVAISASDYYPYLQSKQLCGLLPGLRGAAEYEKACGAPPIATGRMWAQLYTHTLAIALIVIGNVEFFLCGWLRRRKR